MAACTAQMPSCKSDCDMSSIAMFQKDFDGGLYIYLSVNMYTCCSTGRYSSFFYTNNFIVTTNNLMHSMYVQGVLHFL